MASDKEKRFEKDSEYRIYRLMHLAKKYGWGIRHFSLGIIEFECKSDRSVLTIDSKNLKIDTTLDHPKWGKTTLYRSGKLTHKIVESIFRNPRAHMPKNAGIKSSYQST